MLDSRPSSSISDADPSARCTGRSLKEIAEALIALAPPLPPGQTYDVGPNCPRDDLYYRLEACRALQRMQPRELGPVLRWRI